MRSRDVSVDRRTEGATGSPTEEHFWTHNEQGELIFANLTLKGYEEIDRVQILKPTNELAGRPVVWMHPAFANGHVYARNDDKLVCVSLAK